MKANKEVLEKIKLLDKLMNENTYTANYSG